MKEKIKDTSKEELVFTEKEPCLDCKPKEMEMKTKPYTDAELELAMIIIGNVKQTREEMEWLINLNNRALKDKKQFGCGKCHVQVMKNLRNLYVRNMDKS